jgi:hypothetical protein
MPLIIQHWSNIFSQFLQSSNGGVAFAPVLRRVHRHIRLSVDISKIKPKSGPRRTGMLKPIDILAHLQWISMKQSRKKVHQ